MALETMNRMVGRALTDRRFREDLLRSPGRATRGLPLTQQERRAVSSVRAASLDEFSRKLNQALPEPPTVMRFDRPLRIEPARPSPVARPKAAASPRRQAFVRRPRSLGQGFAAYSARFILRMLGAFLVLGTLTTVVARASQVVTPSGEGVSIASGYLVSGFEYSLSPADPARIQSVSFRLTAAQGSGVPSQVSISLDGGSRWTSCEASAQALWSCPAQASVADLSSVRVVAAQ